MNNITKLVRTLGKSISNNSPSILTGLGIAGFWTSVVMAVKVTPKALEIIEDMGFKEAENEDERIYIVDVAPRAIIEVTWQLYLPTASMMLLSTASLIFANRINLRRNAALATLYSLAQSTLQEYQDKVIEEVGKRKEEKIRGEVAQKKLDQNPVDENQVIMINDGKTLCFDPLSGRYFMSDIETIRSVVNDYNEQLLNEMTLTLNELYYELGLERTELGSKVGWEIEKGKLNIDFKAKVATNNQPCVVIEYLNPPQHLWF